MNDDLEQSGKIGAEAGRKLRDTFLDKQKERHLPNQVIAYVFLYMLIMPVLFVLMITSSIAIIIISVLLSIYKTMLVMVDKFKIKNRP